MQSFAPEVHLIFSVFDFLQAGLILVVLLWLLGRNSARTDWNLKYLALVFLLLSCHFLTKTFYHYFDLTFRGNAGLIPWMVIAEALSLLLLLHSFRTFRYRQQLTFLFAGLMLAGLPSVRQQASLYWDALRILILLAVSISYARGRKRDNILYLAGAVAYLAYAILFAAEHAVPDTTAPALFCIAENAFKMLALILFALAVAGATSSTYVDFFVRLNLTFIVMACFLIQITTQIQKAQYFELEEQHLTDFSEYLRGNIVYHLEQGKSSREILNLEETGTRIITEFSKFPELRVVRITVNHSSLEVSIDDSGVIDFQLKDNASKSGGASAFSDTTAVVFLPVTWKNRSVGSVEIRESLKSLHFRLVRQMGITFAVFTLAVFLAGIVIGLLVIHANRTITKQHLELQATQRQLLQAAKLASIGELANGVAHEINNPAGVILARSEFLAATAKEAHVPPGFLEDLEAIGRQARRISVIVNDLLSFSRPSELHIRPVDVADVLDRSLELIRPQCTSRGIRIGGNWREARVTIEADPDRLEQVFINVLNNAADAMPSGGEILVETSVVRSVPESVTIRISDTGTGIPEQYLKRIFDPFFTTKEVGKGTGLGLSVSYGIIRDHHGTIRVESALGKGSTFTISLPLRRESDG